jgi:predicted esterase
VAAHPFCPKRLHALSEDACFVLPPKPTTTLLIYLHGIVPPTRDSVQKTNLAEVVANASERAGSVTLLPRGEQGFSPPKYPRWWGWPTSKVGYESQGQPLIDRLRKHREALERLLGVSFERAYLAGSSSGAYFVASVLLHGGMPEIAGYGVLSGGSGYSTPMLATLPERPVYLGFGEYDSVAPPLRALAARLEAVGWPVKLAAHAEGHGAREIYLDEAFAFWSNSARSPAPEPPETGR